MNYLWTVTVDVNNSILQVVLVSWSRWSLAVVSKGHHRQSIDEGLMRILDTSCTKAGRKTLKSTASVLGLVAGAIGWSGLANADKGGPQTLLLPDHYRLMDDGVVVFQLEGGEELSLDPNQYLILEDGLLLITDELAQASMQSLPVMGSIRAQLTSKLQPVRSPDGSVVLAADDSPLWSGDGPAPRLFEEVDIQRYELAQNEQSPSVDEDVTDLLNVGAGGLSLAFLGLASGIFRTKAEQAASEEAAEGGGATTAPVPGEFLTNAQFQALTPSNNKSFFGSAGDSYVGYTAATITAVDALQDVAKGTGIDATFDMSAGGNNFFLAGEDAAYGGGRLNYRGGPGNDVVEIGDSSFDDATVTIDMRLGGNNMLKSAASASTIGYGVRDFNYRGGAGSDTIDLPISYFGYSNGEATFDMTLNGTNSLILGSEAASSNGDITYEGGTGPDALTFGNDVASTGGVVTIRLGIDNASDSVSFENSVARSGGDLKIHDFNPANDTIVLQAYASTAEVNFTNNAGDVVVTGSDNRVEFTIVGVTANDLASLVVGGNVEIG